MVKKMLSQMLFALGNWNFGGLFYIATPPKMHFEFQQVVLAENNKHNVIFSSEKFVMNNIYSATCVYNTN